MRSVFGGAFSNDEVAVVGQSSEVTGYEAANAVVRKGLACGNAWRTSAGTSHWINLTIPSQITVGGLWCAILHSDIASNSTITFGVGTHASPGSDIATVTKCDPQNQWIGYAPAVGSASPFTAVYIDIDLLASAAIEVPLILIGKAAENTDGMVYSTDPTIIDPSQRWTGPQGTVWAREQRIYHGLTLACNPPGGIDNISAIRQKIEEAGLFTPALVIADHDELGDYARALVGTLDAMPTFPTTQGSPVTKFNIKMREMSR